MLGIAGTILSVIGLGFAVAPASATGSADPVTPSVSFHDPGCDDPAAGWRGFVNGSPDSAGDGVTFAVTAGTAGPGATVTVTATAETGYVLEGGLSSKTFEHTFSEVLANCGSGDVEVTPTVQFHNPDTADGTAHWSGYVNGSPDCAGDGVTFEVTSGTVAPGATVTVTATAGAGYVFANGETTQTFTHTFTGASSGDTTVEATVKFTNPSAGQPASWEGFVNGSPDTAGDGVTFEVTSGTVAPGATVTVTATAGAGYVFANGETTQTFTHTFTTAGTGHGTGTGHGSGTCHGSGTGQGTGNTGATVGQGATGTSGTGAPAGQSVVPTAVPAGQTGDQGADGLLRTVAAMMLAAGVLLLLTSGLVIRRQRPGARRA